MKIKKAVSERLTIDYFELNPGESWCVYGTNTSGIHTFVNWLNQNATDGSCQHFSLGDRFGLVSFSVQQQRFEDELKNDQTDFMDRIDPGTPAREFISNIDAWSDLIHRFSMTSLLDKGYRQLSTGQSRKLMILEQVTKRVDWLVIENPFEGLDQDSRQELNRVMALLAEEKTALLLIVHNLKDIPVWCTHIAVIENRQMTVQGPAVDIFPKLEQQRESDSILLEDLPGLYANKMKQPRSQPEACELIRLENGHAGYGGQTVFSGLELTIYQGDHTLVTGPNGSGKSTLVHMITGDHPACYTNRLHVFSKQRGSGESIWDIKKEMGIISSDLHRNYIVPGSALSCVLSGLFDSIGLYQNVSNEQKKAAMWWLEALGIQDRAMDSFRGLHFSIQRLVLIARALIKAPKLLILDEPTQGLDQFYRDALLDFLEKTAEKKICTILYVSHRNDEFRPFFKQQIHMEQYGVKV